MRIAIVHEWLSTYGGSERVTEELLKIYPEADLFTLVDFYPEALRRFLDGKKITCSFIQHLPFARKRFRWYLPLMPLAVEQFDLSSYDLIISSSHAVSKGVITRPYQVHVSYVHSPMRYAWDLENQYLNAAGMSRGVRALGARSLMHYLRMWDVRTANGVDRFVANSNFVAQRIKKIYRRSAAVVHPPVDIGRFELKEQKAEYYITVSRLVSYKRVDLLVQAFNAMPHRRLIVVGDGPEMLRLKALAGPNVELLGHQPFSVMRGLLADARAFVFAAEEDFGIAPVEAQACGTPVIAYGRGGVLDSVVPAKTGMFFYDQTAQAVVEAVNEFEQISAFEPRRIRAHAERFSAAHFRSGFSRIVSAALAEVDSPGAQVEITGSGSFMERSAAESEIASGDMLS